MIRANLLPHSRESVKAFGLALDVEYLRLVALGVMAIALAALAAFGVESFRLSRLTAEATAAEATLAASEPRRNEAQRVAFDLARLEAAARRASELHRSGYAVASGIARIGNALPDRVYLDTLTSDRSTVRLRGSAGSLDRIGDAVTSLGHAFPADRTTLGDVNDRGSGGGAALTFSADVAPRDPAPTTAVPLHLSETNPSR